MHTKQYAIYMYMCEYFYGLTEISLYIQNVNSVNRVCGKTNRKEELITKQINGKEQTRENKLIKCKDSDLHRSMACLFPQWPGGPPSPYSSSCLSLSSVKHWNIEHSTGTSNNKQCVSTCTLVKVKEQFFHNLMLTTYDLHIQNMKYEIKRCCTCLWKKHLPKLFWKDFFISWMKNNQWTYTCKYIYNLLNKYHFAEIWNRKLTFFFFFLMYVSS